MIAGEARRQDVPNVVRASSAQRNTVIPGDILIRQSYPAIGAVPLPMSKDRFPFSDTVIPFGASSRRSDRNLFSDSFGAISSIGFPEFLSGMLYVFPVLLVSFIFIFLRVGQPTFFAHCALVGFVSHFVSLAQCHGDIFLGPIFIAPHLALFAVIPTLHLCFLFFYDVRTRLQFLLIGVELLAVAFYPAQSCGYKPVRMSLGISRRDFFAAWTAVGICLCKFRKWLSCLAFRACFHNARFYMKVEPLST